MPTQEERLSIVEQAIATLRMDLLQVISDNSRTMSAHNRVVVQQEQNLRDVYHEVTILVGVIGSQGQDIKLIKEDLSTLKSDVSAVKNDLGTVKSDLSTLKATAEEQDKKLDQVLLMLSKLTSGSQQEP